MFPLYVIPAAVINESTRQQNLRYVANGIAINEITARTTAELRISGSAV
jgi:hypothetical protein